MSIFILSYILDIFHSYEIDNYDDLVLYVTGVCVCLMPWIPPMVQNW